MSSAARDLLQTPIALKRPNFSVFEKDDEDGGDDETNEEIVRLKKELKKQSDKVSQISSQIAKHLDLQEDLENLQQAPLTDSEGGSEMADKILELKGQLLSEDLLESRKRALEMRKMIVDSTAVQLRARILEFESGEKRKAGEIRAGKKFQKKSNDHITQKLIVSSVTTLQTLRGEDVMTAASWIRRWRLSLQQTGQDAYQKCTSTMLKLDSNLKTMFEQIMRQGEIQWIQKNEVDGNVASDVFTSMSGNVLR